MANTGLVASTGANQATGQDVHTRSKFPFGYKFADTHRFGEYHPFFVMEGVEGDKIDLQCSHDVRSYTLKAPLLQNIQLKKDYFVVPMEAILPLNWDKFYTIPTIGDDVPDNCGPTVVEFWSNVCSLWNTLYNSLIGNNGPTGDNFMTGLFRTLIIGEYFFSEGNLMSSLGIHGGPHFRCISSGVEAHDLSLGAAKRQLLYDEFFDAIVSYCTRLLSVDSFILTIYDSAGNGSQYRVVTNPDPLRLNVSGARFASDINVHTALQMMRDNVFSVSTFVKGSSTITSTLVSNLTDALKGTQTDGSIFSYIGAIVGVSEEDKVDLSRLHAYNIVCTHFYTNDHVDYVYSAQLYRQLIEYYITQVVTSSGDNLTDFNFVYNGLNYQYDALSAFYFSYVTSVLDVFDTLYSNNADFRNGLAYLSQIFSFRRSLRFLDYFTGSRSQPLAVAQSEIDINVDGTAGTGYSVSAINVTKGIQAQRLANAVNRFGRKFEDYIAGMSGKRPAPDYHNPFYLGHTSDVIYGQESEYTGTLDGSDAQNVTSVLRSRGGDYAFQIECDRPSVLIGIAYYDIERFYGRTIERQVFHVNRYDRFNKYMQFIGDQPIYRAELGANSPVNMSPTDGNFAYTNRHMEYKQRYNQCAGAFNIPTTDIDLWLFRADVDTLQSLTQHISPSFIRSWNAELDQFYVSLTGFSLGTYYHFIVKNINNCEANRPMAYAPSIL